LSKKSPCILICNYRTGEKEDQLYNFGFDLKTLGFNKLIQIKPFTKIETEELVFTRFGPIEKSDELIHALFTKTDGCAVCSYGSNQISGKQWNADYWFKGWAF